MAVLRVRKGKQPGATFPVFTSRQPTTLGREGQVDVSLGDPRASRRHAQINYRRGRWLLEDLGSSNGTMVGGEKVASVPLRDGDSLQIGASLLTFHADEAPPCPTFEIHGAQPRETVWEECGVLVLRADQSAMDREIRVDWLHPSREVPDRAHERIEAALRQAEELHHEGFLGLISGKTVRASPEEREREGPWQGTYALLRGPRAGSLGAQWDEVMSLPLEVRVELLRALAELYLERSARTPLRGPLSLERIGLRLEPGRPPRVFLPAIDLGLILAEETGQVLELRSHVDYLPPEYQGQDGSAEVARLPPGSECAMYSLGALGYHLITRQKPMGDGDAGEVLKNHRQVQPAPASLVEGSSPAAVSALLDRMLAKDPAQRPREAAEVLRAFPSPRDVVVPVREAPAPAVSAGPRPRAPVVAAVASPAPVVAAHAAPEPASKELAASGPTRSRLLRPAARGAATGKAPQSLLEKVAYLPLWGLLWVALFFAARYLSRLVFGELGGV